MGKHFELKKILTDFFKKNKNKGRRFIKRKFFELGAPKRSLNRWLKLLYEGKPLDRKKGNGRVPIIATEKKIKKIQKHFDHKTGVSQRKYAKKIGCSVEKDKYSMLMGDSYNL